MEKISRLREDASPTVAAPPPPIETAPSPVLPPVLEPSPQLMVSAAPVPPAKEPLATASNTESKAVSAEAREVRPRMINMREYYEQRGVASAPIYEPSGT